MTAHDPHLVYQGDLPAHFKRRADDTENDAANYTANDDAEDYEAGDADDHSFADAVADEEEGGVNLFAIAVVAATLVVGIGVGAGVTALLMSSHGARPPPRAVAQLAPPAPKPARLAIARAAPPVAAVASALPDELGARAVQPATAAKSGWPKVHRSAARATAAPNRLATSCGTSDVRREMMICSWPAIAAADREMRRAYQHALDVGVERSSLKASQDEWLITSEFAARHSAADLSATYHRRIGELNALAAEEPPH